MSGFTLRDPNLLLRDRSLSLRNPPFFRKADVHQLYRWTEHLNVTNFTPSGFKEGQIYAKKCVNYVTIDIMTNCRNFLSRHLNTQL